MTWETKDLPQLPMTPLYAFLLLTLLGSFAFFEGSPPPSLETRCEMKGGEWLHGSAAPTCVMADGIWLVFNEQADDFLVPGSADEIAYQESQVTGTKIVLAASSEKNTCEGSFEDYPVEGVMGKVASRRPDFSTWPEASRYRTAITKDVARGANFAAHYAVASWGCPQFDGCEGHAVVDVLDGKIIAFGITSSGGAEFSKDSRLFVVTNDNKEESYLLHEDKRTFEKCE